MILNDRKWLNDISVASKQLQLTFEVNNTDSPVMDIHLTLQPTSKFHFQEVCLTSDLK